MGSVIRLSDFKKKSKAPIITEKEEFNLLYEGLISQWRYEESKNNLNRFIADKLQIEQQDFINDRNIVANLELDTNISICVISPTYTDSNPEGWISSFIINNETYSSLEMESESKSRLFCVLLFHALMEAASNVAK